MRKMYKHAIFSFLKASFLYDLSFPISTDLSQRMEKRKQAMIAEIKKNSSNSEMPTTQEKVVSLFQFIEELNKLKQKNIINIHEYKNNNGWFFSLANLPEDSENIKVSYRDRVEDEDLVVGSILLSVHKPEFTRCPMPGELLIAWLEDGWDNYRNQVSVKKVLKIQNGKHTSFSEAEYDEDLVEHFEDSTERVSAYQTWFAIRSEWVNKQRITEGTRNLFSDLYRLYFELQRESETMEMIVATGILYDRDKPEMEHPILTHRVKLNYDADQNTVYVEDTDVPSELYSIAFQQLDDINLTAINKLSADLQKNDYHPLDRNDTPVFLKVLVHQLSSDSMFVEREVPADWKRTNRLLLSASPCYIVRKRLDGTLKAIEQIIENVQETNEIPAPISDIVSGGKIEIPDDVDEESVEEQLAAVGGESIDILLSKEANKEQLEIAKRIESYNAVLVQGPPGTGKTHTIANLMGHFLAHGKSVLVTSHTAKALNVLKDKVAPGLQDLCVSVLDDSHVDMERSIDGITGTMAKTTSHEIKREMDMVAAERSQVISSLAETRRNIYAVINQECKCIVFNGEDISPSKAAEFVYENADTLSYIPGKVRLYTPLPLTFEQLSALYRSNEGVSEEDEHELACDLPSTELLLSPDAYCQIVGALKTAITCLKKIEKDAGWKVSNAPETRTIRYSCPFGDFSIEYPDREAVIMLRDYTASFGKIEKWMKCAAVDGKSGGAYRQKWITLIEQIQKTCDYSESIVSEQFGKDIHFSSPMTKTSLKEPLERLRAVFANKGKISKLALAMHKDYAAALESVSINGLPLQSEKDCDIILHCIEMDNIRKQCAVYWDDLLSPHDVPEFFELDDHNPERVASNWIPLIQKYLDWYAKEYQTLVEKIKSCGFPLNLVFSFNALDSELIKTDRILTAVTNILPLLCLSCEAALDIEEKLGEIQRIKSILRAGKHGDSKYCTNLIRAIDAGDEDAYLEAYTALASIYQKYKLQEDREELLRALEPVAPQWVQAIRARSGIHGQFTVPDTIEDAWKWKQLSGIIDEITAKPFRELQAESLRLSKEYRKITAQFAEKSGWYHLLRKTEADLDMRMALQGWKLTVKKIGKGTGKNAPALKAKARELMTRCQEAVPGWIMPINRALESLNPKQNRFDVIIIDEASQSDISSLAILYMGRKLIIVGDDKQVSPMAVGVEIDKMNALEQMYIQGKIPNSHLYNAKTSIYDIAATTFQPLMLREHFRCVPEIIGFSNMLSYDYKIKPLRDASSSILLPAVVNYRVANGQRDGHTKTNRNEAEAIVALMKACFEQPEYSGKTMGVISLLGDEQVTIIQRLIEEKIDPKEISLRKILCGNSANFQGDERDIIFLSIVDSGEDNGPIRLMDFGVDDAYRKRYNVAASRARDQLWVVHSLDSANDLKPGDIRKTLIDYAENPQSYEIKQAEVEEKAESPFEAAVASALVSRGYHLVQQWKVGAYRLDMVAVCGKRAVAIECDGERWHSGEAKLREDMERQTILERLGWRFIRIRGSEYFRQPDRTMERVINELQDYGIEPEDSGHSSDISRTTDLLERVKTRAWTILQGNDSIKENNSETIAAALGTTEATLVQDEVRAIPIPQEQKATEETTIKKDDPRPTEDSKKVKNSQPKHKTEDPLPSISKPSVKRTRTKTDTLDPNQLALEGLEPNHPKNEDIISFLKRNSVKFIDKRQNGGALWIIGGHELDDIVKKAKALGYHFNYKADGGKQTKGAPGWWVK